MEAALSTAESRKRSSRRRAAFAALCCATVAGLSLLLFDMLRRNGTSWAEYAILALSTLLAVPLSMSYWLAVAGVVAEARGRDPLALDLTALRRESAPLATRTAVVVPIHEEDPAAVLARLRACYESLAATGHLASFDFYVLSDTTSPQRWIDEEVAFCELALELGDAQRLRYRNRAHNTGHKAGNIAEFCEHWGGAYECMAVLDADSVMSGATLVALARAMERDPRIGIIQAPPIPVNARSLFGRLQQFASRAYGPTWAAGLAWLQGGEGNYYGHNAILRIAPFVEHCRLPVLPGPPPLGGSILSHDFVEAALMVRAGRRVYLATGLSGSYEESPQNLIDYAARDRRWCQGNLQHARILGMRGLHGMSRAHLATGVMAYAAAPLWLLLMVFWTVEIVRQALTPHDYFPSSGELFPVWRLSIRFQATMLFVLAMLVLFLPRVLAAASRLRDARERRGFGGAPRFLCSVACEWLLSSMLAPVLMIEHTRFVVSILAGRTSGWQAQRRGEREVHLAEAAARHGPATLLAAAWLAGLLLVSPQFAAWTAPVLGGLLLAIPLTMLSSRADVGRWSRRRGLFLTPEETAPEPILQRLRALSSDAPPEAEPARGSALERVLADSALRELHLSLHAELETSDPLAEHVLAGLVLKCRVEGTSALTDDEQRTILRHGDALLALAADRQASALDDR